MMYLFCFALGAFLGAAGMLCSVAFCLAAACDRPRPSKRLPHAKVDPLPYAPYFQN